MMEIKLEQGIEQGYNIKCELYFETSVENSPTAQLNRIASRPGRVKSSPVRVGFARVSRPLGGKLWGAYFPAQ